MAISKVMIARELYKTMFYDVAKFVAFKYITGRY